MKTCDKTYKLRNKNKESGKRKIIVFIIMLKNIIHKVNLWKNKGKIEKKWLGQEKRRSTQTFQRLFSPRQVKRKNVESILFQSHKRST